MKVLDEHPKRWSNVFFCSGYGWWQRGSKVPCGAKLEVESTDILKRCSTDISGITDTYYGFVCPICKCFTEVSESEIPFVVRSTAREYSSLDTESSRESDDESISNEDKSGRLISW
jgi:hypothetical protein